MASHQTTTNAAQSFLQTAETTRQKIFTFMAKIKKTTLILEVNDKGWRVGYSGLIEYPKVEDKTTFKHDERVIRALISDEELFRLFYRLVDPAYRYYKRLAKKKADVNS